MGYVGTDNLEEKLAEITARLAALEEPQRRRTERVRRMNEQGLNGRGRPLQPCGTRSAYNRHLREGTPTCDSCRAANNRHVADVRERERERKFQEFHERKIQECLDELHIQDQLRDLL